MQKNSSLRCSVEAALDIVSGKWKLALLMCIGSGSANRFGAMKRLLPNITEKTLTTQLRKLEADGLIIRTTQSLKPLKVEYSLTALGHGFMPVIESLEHWATTMFNKNETVVHHSSRAEA